MSSQMFSITDNRRIAEVAEKLKDVSDNRLVAWVNWALGDQADKLAEHIKVNYVSGQRINVITGETRNSIAAWSQRRSRRKNDDSPVFFVRPGIIGLNGQKPIAGLLNYIGRWTGTKHEFMVPAYKTFGGEAYIARMVEGNIIKQCDKLEKEL